MTDTPAFCVRPARLEDCAGIARVQVDSYRTAYAGHFPPAYLEQFSYAEQEQDWTGLLRSAAPDLLLVAALPAGDVAGYVLARAGGDPYPGSDAEIVALHVRREEQGRGIGAALLGHAVLGLSGRGCRSVMLWTLEGNPVRRWYEKLGGRFLGDKSYAVDDWTVREVAYGWESIEQLQDRVGGAGTKAVALSRSAANSPLRRTGRVQK